MIRLTRAQVREVDRRAIEEFHIPGIVLMENAARGVVDVAMSMLAGRGRATIFCGGGNNGGDGLAVARHLHNRGIAVQIVKCLDPMKLPADAATNWQIVQAMRLNVVELPDADCSADLLIDALLGTGATSAPRGVILQAIEKIYAAKSSVLAIDLPSGLDCDTGKPLGTCVRAHKTVTFVAEKAGFASAESRQFTGEIIVVDIGCPRELIEAQN